MNLNLPSHANSAPVSATYSRYAARRFAAKPSLAEELIHWKKQGCSRATMENYLTEIFGLDSLRSSDFVTLEESVIKSGLRRLRIRVLLTLMERDLTHHATLYEVMNGMSTLADVTIQIAAYWAYAQLATRHGIPCSEEGVAQPFLVVGMGKLGGGELNVSSDVDLIFLYPEEGDTRVLVSQESGDQTISPLSNHEFFIRLGKRVIHLLSDLTEDGFVFRVDMMLRPHGKSGPLAISFAMLEDYLTVSGREWERYAWIKARVITTTLVSTHAPVYLPLPSVVAQLDELVTPFIYRRYLDFGAIAAMRAMHAQIRRDADQRHLAKPDRARDVKLGHGGIREIEFIAQVFQLIRGGKEFVLRQRVTLDILWAESSLRLLEADTVETLSQAYVFLRQLEHRIQYLDDAQTHAIPTDADDLARIAQSLGFETVTLFEAQLAAHQQAVSQHFASIFSDKLGLADSADNDPSRIKIDLDDPPTIPALLATQAQAFSTPEEAIVRIDRLANSTRYTSLNEAQRVRFNALLNLALNKLFSLYVNHEVDKKLDDALLRFLHLIETISRRQAYIALLAEHPHALSRVLSILQASGWAAQYLTQHPQLLDELLQTQLLYAACDVTLFTQNLKRKLTTYAENQERQIDVLREEHHAQVFRILAQDLSNSLTVERLSDLLSELADAVLQTTLDILWQSSPYASKPMRFAVVAYGKLGGKELGYASDLDLIFLYDPGEEDHDSFDPSPYIRLAQRLITWLSSHTAAGRLFEIDTALRPNGRNGMLVTSLESFRRYQMREGDNAAWIWEHQALTRARYCAGDDGIGRQFEAIRTTVLSTQRDAAALAAEVIAMRTRVHEGHPNTSDTFDLKHDQGGMVDIEFMVQFLVLAYAHSHHGLTGNIGNIALLRLAAEVGLIDAALSTQVQAAYRTYRKLQHAARLEGADRARVAHSQVAAEIEAVTTLWQQVFRPYLPPPAAPISTAEWL